MLKVLVVTLFPEMFEAITGHGISGRAVRNGLVELDTLNPRDYAANSHRNVDDRPYGGGPGMVMMVQPLQDALREARAKRPGAKVIYLSPQGRPLDQAGVVKLATDRDLVLICGRYEGIDERFIELEVDEEWSVGDYVVSGGELPAMLLIDAMVRTLPGALGHEDSADEDSFVNGLLDYPHYTRPESYQGLEVPAVLLSGDHARIRRWRMKQALGRTWERRPDLLEKLVLDAEQEALLQEYREESNNTLSSQPE